MRKLSAASLAVTGLALLGLSGSAMAAGHEAGSLIVYPIFDNTTSAYSVISVANTNGTIGAGGTIDVEFVYINGDTCLEFNRTQRLTAKDTFTAVTRFHNPNAEKGYVYAFAKSTSTGRAIAWDYLIGSMMVFNGEYGSTFESVPYVFKAGTLRSGQPWPDGTQTDMDNDGVRDLDGKEYEKVGDIVMVPLFLGNGNNQSLDVHSYLVLLGLTGARFTTIIDFLIYNDNEEVFSAQRQFDCWERIRLTDITGVFYDSFLQTTNNSASETQGLTEETGWYEMNGRTAFSTAAQISQPAFLAMQIQRVGGDWMADRAFTRGTQCNGKLLPLGLFGDNNPNNCP